MGRRKYSRKHATINEDTFKRLDRTYRANEGGDLLVRAFNTLNADDRALMLAYMSCGNNIRALARSFGVTRQTLGDKIWRIQVVVKERYEKYAKATEI